MAAQHDDVVGRFLTGLVQFARNTINTLDSMDLLTEAERKQLVSTVNQHQMHLDMTPIALRDRLLRSYLLGDDPWAIAEACSGKFGFPWTKLDQKQRKTLVRYIEALKEALGEINVY